jgi:hypothetical protein
MGVIIYGNDDSPVVPLLVYMFSKIGYVPGFYILLLLFGFCIWSLIPCRGRYISVVDYNQTGSGIHTACHPRKQRCLLLA